MSTVPNSTTNRQPCGPIESLACEVCMDAPLLESEQQTWYSSTQCCNADKSEHKTICDKLVERRNLYRIGDIVQEIFWVYRPLINRLPLSLVLELGPTLRMEFDYTKDPKDHHYLLPIPGDAFYRVFDTETRHSVLAWNSCTHAVTWMSATFEYLLEQAGFTTTAWYETEVLIGTPLRDFVVSNSHGVLDATPKRIDGTTPHNLWVSLEHEETSPSSSSYCLDLTGTQFNYHKTVVPYPEYKSRIDLDKMKVPGEKSNGGVYPLGAMRKEALRRHEKLSNKLTIAHSGVSGIIPGVVEEWEILDDGLKIVDLLKLPQQEFDKKMQELVNYVEFWLKQKADNLRAELMASASWT